MTRLKSLHSRLLRDIFTRNVLVLFTGTSLAQAISILAAPIITRLYSPEQYGVYALLLAIVNVASAVIAGRYEMAIILPEADEDAFNLLSLSVLVAGFTSAVSLAIVTLFGRQLSNLLNSSAILSWLPVVPAALLLTGVYNALNYWNNRRKNFKRLATNRVLRTSLSAASNVGMGIAGLGVAGLVAGWFVGQFLTTSQFFAQIWRDESSLRRQLSLAAMRRMARRYRQFPKYLVPSAVVESAAGQFPSIFLSASFGSATLGLFALATNMVNLPLALIAGSIRDVFWQAASEEYSRSGDCRGIFIATLRRLLPLALLSGTAILLLGPLLFGLVFGDEWRDAGSLAQIMAVMFGVRTVSSPLSSMFYIAEKQKWDLAIQCTLLVLIIGGMVGVTQLTGDARAAVAVYALIYTLKYLIELHLSYRLTRNPLRVGSRAN